MDEQGLSLQYEKEQNEKPGFLKRLKKLKKEDQNQKQAVNKITIHRRKKRRFKKKVYRRVFKDLSTYKGQVENNLRHGFGKQEYMDGSFYIGQFRNGKRNGYGQFKDKLGQNRYWGQYKNGYRDGNGKLSIADKYFYQGQFKNGKFNGFGKLQFLDKSTYQGIFQQGRWAKKGTYIDKNGNVFNLGFNQQNDSQLQSSIIDWMALKQITQFIPLNKYKASKKQKNL